MNQLCFVFRQLYLEINGRNIRFNDLTFQCSDEDMSLISVYDVSSEFYFNHGVSHLKHIHKITVIDSEPDLPPTKDWAPEAHLVRAQRVLQQLPDVHNHHAPQLIRALPSAMTGRTSDSPANLSTLSKSTSQASSSGARPSPSTIFKSRYSNATLNPLLLVQPRTITRCS